MAEEQRIVSTHEGMSPLWITLLNQMRDAWIETFVNPESFQFSKSP